MYAYITFPLPFFRGYACNTLFRLHATSGRRRSCRIVTARGLDEKTGQRELRPLRTLGLTFIWREKTAYIYINFVTIHLSLVFNFCVK
jgi:hypothetical protein